MFKLNSLKFKNLGRFTTEQEINFASKGHLVEIGGINLTTKSGSGVGKSSLIEALYYNLGLNKTPATLLQSRFTKDILWTQGEYQVKDTVLKITRSTKEFSIEWNDGNGTQIITGNNEAAQRKLEEFIGMDSQLFRRMTLKAQGEAGFFLSLTPKESFNFLIKLLGLESWLEKLDKLDADSSVQEKQVQETQTILNSLGPKIKDQEEILKNLEAEKIQPPLEIDLETINQNITTLETSKKDLKNKNLTEVASLKSSLQSSPVVPEANSEIKIARQDLLNLNEYIKTKEEEHKDKLNKVSQALEGLRKEYKIVSNLENEKKNKLNKATEIEENLVHLKANNCPTCLREWKDEAFEAKVKGLSSNLNALKTEISKMEEKLLTKAEIEDKISRGEAVTKILLKGPKLDDVKQKSKDISVLIEGLIKKDYEVKEAIMAEFNAEQKKVLESINSINEKNNRSILAIDEDLLILRQKVTQYESEVKFFTLSEKTRHNNIEAQKGILEKYNKELDQAMKAFNKAQETYLLAQEAKRLIKSFLNKMFEEALETIGRKATEKLNRIPNMSSASLYFETFKEVKGKIKEEVTPMLCMDGDLGIPLKTLSGGERSTADLSVDLSVSEFIEDHTGLGAEWLILDEPFGGLSVVDQLEYLEILKTIGSNKQFLIVSHSSEIKEVFDDEIRVEREGLTSRIV
jgi:DNA repair exonuclease SbcCD ATPase subunit